jgi:hypothetical protein
VTVLEFSEPRNKLTFAFRVRGVYFGVKGVDAFSLAARAEEVPIQYTPDEWIDLAGYLRPHADDPDGSVAAWTKSFVAGDLDRTIDVLRRMPETFRRDFNYRARGNGGNAVARRNPADAIGHLSRLCLADDRDFAPARHSVTFRERIFVRRGTRRR